VWTLREASRYKRAGTWPTTGDPNFANVSLLLHMDGSNGSTTFTDSSGTPKTVTANGNAQISTAQSKFGGASGYFDGSGDFVVATSPTAFEFGTGDFTAECWFYAATGSNGGVAAIMTTATGSSDEFGFFVGLQDDSNIIWLFGDGTWAFFRSVSGFPTDSWSHLALTRSSGVAYLFLNGTVIDSVSDSTDLANPNQAVAIGGRNLSGGQYFTGYIDELRITKGVARYTANFTPPTAPFPDA
jgi:hypothetical protein